MVGYAQSGLQAGATLVAPQFTGLNASGLIDLQSIQCNDGCSDSVFIMTLDDIGLAVDTYSWVDWYGDNGDEKCWLDGATMERADGVTFQPGQGLWVQGDSDGQILQTAGKVGSSDVLVKLRPGATVSGNPTPVAIDLQDIICNDGCSDSVFIMTLDEIGLAVNTYSWVDWYGDNGDEKCWLDGATMERAEGVTFQPGQGLWIQGDSEEQAIVFPAVEL